VEPVLTYYDEGTVVTMSAEVNPGFFFHSWSGTNSSVANPFSFKVTGNVEVEALFYPEGTVMDTSMVGYATVQDDRGTPCLLTGGAYGETVEAATQAELELYLESEGPRTVTVSGKIEGEGEVNFTSDKTLLGLTDSAYIKGIKMEISEARNIIIRNLKLSHVVRYDEIEITGKSRNIWIDHCELFTDRDHDLDYYDGLLDIKNEASFITISWNEFHDHHKTSLISSGDQCTFDTVIRVTYHHNYFHDCGSRLPSIRFGKAHIFNNYYLNCNDAISTRMGACVRVENNYFENIQGCLQ
jgi:pectate lyase